MRLNILKNMFALSKQVPKPNYVDFSTDYYKSIHLKLTDIAKQQQFHNYVRQLVSIQEKYNSQTHPHQQTRAIWVHMNNQNLGLMEKLSLQMKFKIHHGLNKELVMYKWISELSDQATPYSMFYISCGAAVLKDGCIYLVQEKGGARKGKYGLPGGRADFGESLKQCSERELFQETGIKAKFSHLLYFRQMTNTVFGGVDMYFVCLMKCDEKSLEEMKLCQRQLTDAKWVPMKQYKQFSQKNSFGTQFQVATYFSQLHEKGFDFQKRIPNQTLAHEYTSPRDNITRSFIEHLMVESKKV